MRVGVAHIYKAAKGFSAYMLSPWETEAQHVTGFHTKKHAENFIRREAGEIISFVAKEHEFWRHVEMILSPKLQGCSQRFLTLSPRIQKTVPKHLSRLNTAYRKWQVETEKVFIPYWQEHVEEELDWFKSNGIALVKRNGNYETPSPLPDLPDDTMPESDDSYYRQEVLAPTRETRRLDFGSRRVLR